MGTKLPHQLCRTYDLVAEAPNLAADAAFVGVLNSAAPPIREIAMQRLFDRGHTAGLALLVSGFNNFDGDLRKSILRRSDELLEAVRLAISDQNLTARLAAIELIRQARAYHLAYLLSEALARQCPRTKDAAASTLRELTLAALEARDSATSLVALDNLGDAVRGALNGWRLHFRADVLVAAIWLIERTEVLLFKMASSPRLRLAGPLNEALRLAQGPWSAGYCLRALLVPELRPTASRAIAAATDHRFIERLLDEMWISYQPAHARACSSIARLAWYNEGSEFVASLSPTRARAAVRLMALSGIPPIKKVAHLQKVLSDAAEPLRETAMWHLIQTDPECSTECLRHVSQLHTGIIREWAEHELFRRNPTKRVTLAGDEYSPKPVEHGDAVEPDQKAVWQGLFDRFWEEFEHQDLAGLVGRTKQLKTRLPDLVYNLHSRLEGRHAADRRRALHAICVTGVMDHFREKIFASCHDQDDTVRSRALGLLSQLGGRTASRIAQQALYDPDERVQANAVETLESLEPENLIETIKPKLSSLNNRVQANTVKALLRRRVRGAARTLLDMLEHPSGSYRNSALWVVGRLRLSSLWSHVERLARSDGDGQVRRHAERVLGNLSTPMVAIATARDGG